MSTLASPKSPSKKDLGTLAESRAQAYLEAAGLRLLKKNFHCRVGELDLIMKDKDTLVFVEVRSKQSHQHGNPLETITQKKRHHLIQSAQYYLQQYCPSYPPCRFDVVSVCGPQQITWIRDAFQLER